MIDPVDTVRTYYELVDAHDVTGILDLFTDDCVYERPGYEPFRGRDALERFYTGRRRITVGAHTLTRCLQADATVAVEGVFEGTLDDSRHVEVGFAEFFKVIDGRIHERRTYFYEPSV